MKRPGAYTITHIASGCIYVGSSGDLDTRKRLHLSSLRLGDHRNDRLQDLFIEDDRLEFVEYPTATKNEALTKEQELIDYHKSPLLLNVYTLDVRNPSASRAANGFRYSEESRERMSRAQLGKTLTEECKQKMRDSSSTAQAVMIEGVRYSSVNDAARMLGMTRSAVRSRLTAAKHTNWIYLKENEND